MARGHLPQELGIVGVAAPCREPWEQMHGNDQVRRCRSCDLNVYNLDGLTAFEVRDLLMKTEGRLCVRLFVRRDGTLLTRDCPSGWAQVAKLWKDQRARARLAGASPILWVSMALVLTANVIFAAFGTDFWSYFRPRQRDPEYKARLLQGARGRTMGLLIRPVKSK
jgi:hypothetical protein